jgi:hypothetical protein
VEEQTIRLIMQVFRLATQSFPRTFPPSADYSKDVEQSSESPATIRSADGAHGVLCVVPFAEAERGVGVIGVWMTDVMPKARRRVVSVVVKRGGASFSCPPHRCPRLCPTYRPHRSGHFCLLCHRSCAPGYRVRTRVMSVGFGGRSQKSVC